ncbi:hypothetical protein RA28_09690 [Ruegeria sp. ANG-S4]|nr:hypothetical protein RA28_09690 [Ruegeria sp. ANG-S4]
MFKTNTLTAAVAAAVLAATGAFAGAPAVTGQFDNVTYLMNAEKMTLYTFDKDEKDKSNCYGDCATKWPPLTADDSVELSKGYSLIERTDGTKQVAYKGQPLYLWFKDQKPGDMTGDGVKDVWHVAKP